MLEPHLDAAVIADAARGHTVGIVLTADDKGALALDGTGERAQLALEFDLVEHETRAAGGIGQKWRVHPRW